MKSEKETCLCNHEKTHHFLEKHCANNKCGCEKYSERNQDVKK